VSVVAEASNFTLNGEIPTRSGVTKKLQIISSLSTITFISFSEKSSVFGSQTAILITAHSFESITV